MAVKSGFFNAKEKSPGVFDRLYDNVDISSMFDGIVQDGVIQGYKEGLVVRPGDGLKVVVNTGRAWFNHTYTVNDTDLVLDVTKPDVTYRRYDSVILEVNSSEDVRANSIRVISGSPAGSPVPPKLTHNDLVNQYSLANILVRPKATSITAGDISDRRGTADTPYAKGATINPDISDTLKHWRETFGEQSASFDKQFKEFLNTATGNPGLAVPISNTQIDDMFK